MRVIRHKSILFGILLSMVSISGYAQIASSFSKAKSNLYKKVYSNSGQTFYLNCQWSNKKVDLSSCGQENAFPRKHMKRASRTEVEHIIPASWMYKKDREARSCVGDSKASKLSARKYCQKHDRDFRNAHNDLVNLRPAVGQINAERSNKPFSDDLSGSKFKTYRGNGKTFKATSRVVVIDQSVRGDVARMAFYMRDVYGVTYSARQLKLFDKWNKEDPLDEAEIELNMKIKKVQGTGNHYVLSRKLQYYR